MKLKPYTPYALQKIAGRMNERNSMDFPFAVCDIEAADWSQFRMIGWYDGQIFSYFLSLFEFLEFIGHNEDYKREKCFDVFAHFGGGYDFKFILEEAYSHKDLYLVENMIPYGTTAKVLCFDLTCLETGIKFHFSDSLAFLPFSLKELCKKFNPKSKKLDDFDVRSIDVVDEKCIEYNRLDCQSLHEIIRIYESHHFISKVGLRPTVASQAMAIFRLFLQNDVSGIVGMRRKSTKETQAEYVESLMRHDTFIRGCNKKISTKYLAYQFEKNRDDKHIQTVFERGELPAYFGGRTEVFIPWFEPTKNKPCLNYYDFNSLYPSVMCENIFPHQPMGALTKFCDKIMGFWEVTVEVPTPEQDNRFWIPPLGVLLRQSTGNKFMFPVGTFTGKWSTPELVHALSLGVKIVKFHRGVRYSSSGYLFQDYVRELYEKRLEAKRKGDKVMDIITKLLLNSLYGRFGLNCEREKLMEDDFSVGTTDTDFYLETPEGRIPFCRKKEMAKLFSNVSIAAFVTSYGRIKLHKALLEAGEAFYCDTDSIITPTEMNHGDDLGMLKLEKEIDGTAAFILPKAYSFYASKDADEIKNPLGKTIKIKGLSDKLVKQYSPDDLIDFFRGNYEISKMEDKEEADAKRNLLRKIKTEVSETITVNGQTKVIGKGLKGITRALHDDRRIVANENPLIREIRSLYDKRKIVETRSGVITVPWELRDGNIVNE